MTRVLSYNILFGGSERINQIEQMIRAADPDIVGLMEALNPEVVQELARRLGMQYCTNASPDGSWRTSIALLSRLPILQSTVHAYPGVITRPLLEVTLQEAHGEKLTVFVTHLIASFSHGRGNDMVRRKEMRAILRIMRANHGPHMLIGDFNALAPGDKLKASILLRYLIKMDQHWHKEPHDAKRKGNPSLNGVVPPSLHFLFPLLHLIPHSRLLSALFDEAGSLYAPRGTIHLVHKAGYVDCFRYINPRAWGFTCPAKAPAGRIDYLFANPLLATRLSACKVVNGNEYIRGGEASDHLPVMAEFGTGIETHFRTGIDQFVETEEVVGEMP